MVRRDTGRLDNLHVVFSDAALRRLHVFAPAQCKAADSLAGRSACHVAVPVSGVPEHSAIDLMETRRGGIARFSDRGVVAFDSRIAVFCPVHNGTFAVAMVQPD